MAVNDLTEYPMDQLSSDKIDAAIELMLPIIERDGSARVGWALQRPEVIGPFDPKRQARTHVNKIAGKICKDGKYKALFADDLRECWIHINHEYELNRRVNQATRNSLILAGISTIFIFVSVCIDWCNFNLEKTKQEDFEHLRASINHIQRQIDSLKTIASIPQKSQIKSTK